MPGSHADDIVGEYFEAEDWAALVDAEADPELEPPAQPEPAQAASTLWRERGVSSAGRAPALQAGGHRFDPGTLH
jgi:hypothetical protein